MIEFRGKRAHIYKHTFGVTLFRYMYNDHSFICIKHHNISTVSKWFIKKKEGKYGMAGSYITESSNHKMRIDNRC